MPRYRKKPVEIEAVKFNRDSIPEGVKISGSPDSSLKNCVWNELHQSWIYFKDHDFLRVDNLNDVYPIDHKTFKETYDPLDKKKAE